jgi:hypothetical protein
VRAVIGVGKGALELNYMWLPTFIGMNGPLKQDMERDLQEKMKGIAADEDGLDYAHDLVVKYLTAKFSDVKGLDLYLDAMKYLEP